MSAEARAQGFAANSGRKPYMAARKSFTMTPSNRTTISNQSVSAIDEPAEAVVRDDANEEPRERDATAANPEAHGAVLLADRDGDWFFARRP